MKEWKLYVVDTNYISLLFEQLNVAQLQKKIQKQIKI